jgi:nucleotide-binding universal stress UspA family protein
MTESRTFIVAVRDEPSARVAFARASHLAAAGDRIVLVHARRKSLFMLMGAGEMMHAIPDLALAELSSTDWFDQLQTSLGAPDSVDIDCRVLDGDPAAAIADLARAEKAAMIVVAGHRQGLVRELAFGSTALRILRRAPCPVLVARNTGSDSYRAATLAVTADPSSERIIAAATRLLPKSAMTLLHAYRLPDEASLRMRGVPEEQLLPLRERLREKAQQALQPLLAQAAGAKLLLEYGFAPLEIVDHVQHEKPDVLVISQHRGSLLDERLLGSVAQHALYHAGCDLLLVP